MNVYGCRVYNIMGGFMIARYNNGYTGAVLLDFSMFIKMRASRGTGKG